MYRFQCFAKHRCIDHKWKKFFTFWEGAWTLKNFCQKIWYFQESTENFGSIRQDMVIILTFADEKKLFSWILSYIRIICSQNTKYICTYFPKTHCHFWSFLRNIFPCFVAFCTYAQTLIYQIIVWMLLLMKLFDNYQIIFN